MIGFVIVIFISIIFPGINELTDNGKVYEQLKLYKRSGKSFECLLNNKQVVYASNIIELDSLVLIQYIQEGFFSLLNVV